MWLSREMWDNWFITPGYTVWMYILLGNIHQPSDMTLTSAAQLPGYLDCEEVVHLVPGETGTIPGSSGWPVNMSFTSVYCLSAPSKDFLIRFTFVQPFHMVPSPDCQDHVHIGNGLNSIGRKSLTSYRFCGPDLPPQIVSRTNSAWIVFQRHSRLPYTVSLKYEALEKVDCSNSSLFHCSEVECVSRDHVCDGVQHCSNGLDEYCVSENYSPTEACFLCEDGSCILPRQTGDSIERNKRWWWLCDNYNHCSDGTDESVEVCIGLESRSGSLFSCQAAFGKQSNISVNILRKFVCDGLAHCENKEDEAMEICEKTTDLRGFKKEMVYFPVISVAVFAILMASIYLIGKLRRHLKKNHDRENPSQVGRHRGSINASEKQGLNSDCPSEPCAV